MANVFEIVTRADSESSGQGHNPWRKPWTSKIRFPRNLVTEKHYRGINVWLLLSPGYYLSLLAHL